MAKREQIFGIASGQCGSCEYGMYSDIFYGETLCKNRLDHVILYPEITGTKVCPYYEEEDE